MLDYRHNSSNQILSLTLLWLIQVIYVVSLVSGYNSTLNYIATMTIPIWILVALSYNSNSFIRTLKNKSWFFFLCYLIFYILTSFFYLDIRYMLKYSVYYILIFFPIIITCFYINISNINIIKKSTKAVLLIWFFFTIIAIRFYLNNPYAARILASDKDFYGNKAVGGGYFLAYGSAILCVFIFDLFINGLIKNKTLKRISPIGVFILLLLIYLTGSTLTLFATAIGLIFSIYFKVLGNATIKKNLDKTEYSYRKIFVWCLTVIIILIIVLNYKYIGLVLVQISQGKTDALIYRRLDEAGRLLAYSSQTNHVMVRISTLIKSWELFLTSPVIGHGYEYGNVFSLGKLYGIGNHSEWLDNLARHGLIGSIPLFLTYYYFIKYERNFIIKGSIAWVITLFLLGLFNPFKAFHSNLVVFFIIPMITFMLNHNVDIKK